MRLAILMANTDESAFAHRHPLDGAKWPALLAAPLPEARFEVFAVKDGVMPQEPPGAFDGFIVTGSPASVHDRDPWLDQLGQLIRQIVSARVKLFGACFGHQAIAMALGGTVGKNPAGWEFGVVRSEVHEPAPWMQPGPIWLNAAHEEQVTALPAPARNLARRDGCPLAGFAIGDHVFTTQYHPEITPAFMAALIDELAPVKPAEVTAKARTSLSRQPENARFARWLADFFRS